MHLVPTYNFSYELLSMSYLLGFWSPGPMELVIIGVIVLLLFGSRLPSVMRFAGHGHC